MCSHSSVDLFAPSILPSIPSMLFSFIVKFVHYLSLHCEKNKIKCNDISQEDVLHIYIRNPTIGKTTSPSTTTTKSTTTVSTSETEIPAQKYRPVLKKFSGSHNWPQQSVILPGNEVLFSLETASDYIKDDKVSLSS